VTASLDAQLAVQLCASMDGVARQLGQRQSYLADLMEGITSPEAPAIAFLGSAAAGGVGGAYAPQSWGPAMGFTWFVQLMTVGPLASGDTLAVYRGLTAYDNEDQRLKNQFTGANGTWQVWHPGRTGLQLRGGKGGLVFDPGSGTLTSATRYFVNVDVIQVADRHLASFLV